MLCSSGCAPRRTTMKLSDAIALGRTVSKLNDNTFTLNDGEGCALGVALIAAGFTHKVGFERDVTKYFPWVGHREYEQISEYYDNVVRGRATLDELIDWVRSVEPAEVLQPSSAETAHEQTR